MCNCTFSANIFQFFSQKNHYRLLRSGFFTLYIVFFCKYFVTHAALCAGTSPS